MFPESLWWLIPVTALSALVVALLTAGLTRPLLRATDRFVAQHPHHHEPDDPEPVYANLATSGFGIAVAICTLVASSVTLISVAPTHWSAWFGLVTVGSLLVCIDARTMWLPLLPTRLLWLLTAAGALLLPIWSSTGWWALLGALVGSVGYGFLLAAIWWLARGALGFGDVRLAFALGAALGAHSLWAVAIGAMIGTGLAAVWAIGTLLRQPRTGRKVHGHDLPEQSSATDSSPLPRNPIPYGPFLFAGAILAPLLS